MSGHRWSGWPGAWCLDCGIEDPVEIALADGDYIEVDDDSSMGFHFEFPNVKLEPCPCPGEGRYDPYAKALELDARCREATNAFVAKLMELAGV